jgi:serine phosphatase RsbU (regulator of sigma subunit)
MPNSPIRLKLALLAGVPVLAALVLAVVVVRDARLQSRKTEALGTIEHLAQLSETMSLVVHELQMERALVALDLGGRPRVDPQTDAAELSVIRKARRQAPEKLLQQHRQTDSAFVRLDQFLRARGASRLPARLSDHLDEARQHWTELQQFRRRLTDPATELHDVLTRYREPTRALIQGIAGLTDLTDNGELLRLLTSLAAVLEIKERASQEQAVLGHVFAAGKFPPGAYRALVTIVTEETAYSDVFRTNASTEQLKLYDENLDPQAVARTIKMRSSALESTDDDFQVEPDEWFAAQQTKVTGLGTIERELNTQVKRVALAKIAETRRAELGTTGLAGAVLAISVLLAGMIARGVTRSVAELRDAAYRVGQGDLSVRVRVTSRDELGALGRSFNSMIEEVGRSRAALSEQVRMARELEIAASIQQALLPPEPRHPEFEFAGRMNPADEVGGDFYDVHREQSSAALWITVGDVSGHGLEAGLVMLMAQSAFASQFRADPNGPPERALCHVNGLLCENITRRLHDKKYVTAQLLAYRGQGKFSCAGAHTWPIVYRSQSRTCQVVETPGPWLGIEPNLGEVPLTEIEVGIGDILCLYSDGLPEARDLEGNLFDVPRLAQAISEAASQGWALPEIVDSVFARVSAHSSRRDDDWTLLLVKRMAQC